MSVPFPASLYPLNGQDRIRFRDCPANRQRNRKHGVIPAHPRETNMRSGLLWLIGIPLPIIIILWLITGHA
jgi:hypothetical protein